MLHPYDKRELRRVLGQLETASQQVRLALQEDDRRDNRDRCLRASYASAWAGAALRKLDLASKRLAGRATSSREGEG